MWTGDRRQGCEIRLTYSVIQVPTYIHTRLTKVACCQECDKDLLRPTWAAVLGEENSQVVSAHSRGRMSHGTRGKGNQTCQNKHKGDNHPCVHDIAVSVLFHLGSSSLRRRRAGRQNPGILRMGAVVHLLLLSLPAVGWEPWLDRLDWGAVHGGWGWMF